MLKAYTPGYVQSQIDLLKRQKKFTTKLVLEKPKLPPKKLGKIHLKVVQHKIFLKDRLILYHSKALIQHPQLILLLQQTLFLHPATTQGPEILNQLRSGKAGSGTGAIIPPEYKKQRAYRGDASKYSLKNASELRRLQDYLWFNGSLEACLTPKDGDCLYSALKWGIDFPQEYSADLLKRQVIVTICEHPYFFFEETGDRDQGYLWRKQAHQRRI